jgi:hypothetical protein
VIILQQYHTDGTLANIASGAVNVETRWPDRQDTPPSSIHPRQFMLPAFYKFVTIRPKSQPPNKQILAGAVLPPSSHDVTAWLEAEGPFVPSTFGTNRCTNDARRRPCERNKESLLPNMRLFQRLITITIPVITSYSMRVFIAVVLMLDEPLEWPKVGKHGYSGGWIAFF